MLASLVFGVFSSSVAMSAENTTFPFTTEQFINNQNQAYTQKNIDFKVTIESQKGNETVLVTKPDDAKNKTGLNFIIQTLKSDPQSHKVQSATMKINYENTSAYGLYMIVNYAAFAVAAQNSTNKNNDIPLPDFTGWDVSKLANVDRTVTQNNVTYHLIQKGHDVTIEATPAQ